MTREEILKLPAGRKLDAIVAERVMNHLLPFVQRPIPCPDGLGGCCVLHHGTFDSAGVRIPNYSGDIAAAWQVVEHLTSFAYVKMRVEDSTWHGGYCSIRCAAPEQREIGDLVVRDAGPVSGDGTVPHAICLAALIATMPDDGPSGKEDAVCPTA